jgi:hypothetical protein
VCAIKAPSFGENRKGQLAGSCSCDWGSGILKSFTLDISLLCVPEFFVKCPEELKDSY